MIQFMFNDEPKRGKTTEKINQNKQNYLKSEESPTINYIEHHRQKFHMGNL